MSFLRDTHRSTQLKSHPSASLPRVPAKPGEWKPGRNKCAWMPRRAGLGAAKLAGGRRGRWFCCAGCRAQGSRPGRRPGRPAPSPVPGAGSESAPTSTGPSLPWLASPRRPRVYPILGGRSNWCIQLGSQEQQRQPVGSKVGWNKAAGTPPPDLGQGSGPPPFLPGFGGRSPETKCLGTGATSSSRNQAWGLELLEISSWSLELR